MARLAALAIGYVFGLFQTAYIYGRMKGIDIRKYGSGNAGTTNTLRVLGTKAGLIVLLGDILKCILAIVTVRLIFTDSHSDMSYLLAMYAAAGAILGHNFPFYLGFKGGKGISSTSGFILAFDLRISAICLVCFIAAVGITRYVSLGSLIVTALNFILGIIFCKIGWISIGDAYFAEYVILLLIITAQAYIRHRANIKRLLSGTENKVGTKK